MGNRRNYVYDNPIEDVRKATYRITKRSGKCQCGSQKNVFLLFIIGNLPYVVQNRCFGQRKKIVVSVIIIISFFTLGNA